MCIRDRHGIARGEMQETSAGYIRRGSGRSQIQLRKLACQMRPPRLPVAASKANFTCAMC
eukprot:14296022-Alexandrium_andersonii.AAC.1